MDNKILNSKSPKEGLALQRFIQEIKIIKQVPQKLIKSFSGSSFMKLHPKRRYYSNLLYRQMRTFAQRQQLRRRGPSRMNYNTHYPLKPIKGIREYLCFSRFVTYPWTSCLLRVIGTPFDWKSTCRRSGACISHLYQGLLALEKPKIF